MWLLLLIRNFLKGGNRNIPIESVENVKYLGIFLDKYLNCNCHTQYVCKKISSTIGMFKLVSKYIPRHAKLIMYNSFVLPYYDYCSTIWFQTSMCNLKKKVQVLQNRALRFILNCNYEKNVKDMYKELGLLNVRQICLYNLILMYTIKNSLVSKYLLLYDTEYKSNHNLRSYDTNNIYVTNNHFKSLYTSGVQ